jgi:hypothetical protein
MPCPCIMTCSQGRPEAARAGPCLRPRRRAPVAVCHHLAALRHLGAPQPHRRAHRAPQRHSGHASGGRLCDGGSCPGAQRWQAQGGEAQQGRASAAGVAPAAAGAARTSSEPPFEPGDRPAGRAACALAQSALCTALDTQLLMCDMQVPSESAACDILLACVRTCLFVTSPQALRASKS